MCGLNSIYLSFFCSIFFDSMGILFYFRRYYGEFSNGMPSGDGRFTFKDGSVYSRCDHNGILSPNSVPQTPATEASSHPSESSHNDCSPMSNVTMSPVLSTTAKKDKEQIKDDSSDNASDIDIPALNETTKEVADAITFDGESARTSEKDSEDVIVEAIEGNELPSRILPYKRGPSIPNITSFSPKETESVGSDSDYGLAKTETEEKTNEPLVFLDDASTSSVHSPVRGGLNALLQNKLEEDSESVRHLIETPVVLKLDETKQDVMKYLDTVPGKTTSASYVYSEIGTYNGEFCDGYPHGVGTFFWIDGTTYSGNFVEGEPDGDGKLVLPSGEMFVRSAESNEIIHIPAQQKDDVSVAKSVDSRISAQSVESGEAGKYKGQIVAGVPHGLGTSKFILRLRMIFLLLNIFQRLHCLYMYIVIPHLSSFPMVSPTFSSEICQWNQIYWPMAKWQPRKGRYLLLPQRRAPLRPMERQ